MQKKVCGITLGCKVNQYETEAMLELFGENGYEIVNDDEVADIYIINTCTVTNFGDKKSRQAIRKVKRQNENAIVAVVGCYAQTAPQDIEKIEGVNLIIGTKGRTQIVDLVENYTAESGIVNKVEDIMKIKEFEEFPLKELKGRTRAYLKIQDGCNNFCTYCIIPYARGPIRSRKPEEVIKEVKTLAQNGFKEIVLTGIHVASYGKDLGNINLLQIIEQVHQIEGIERIRFSSIEPNVITDEFLEGLDRLPKVCDHFHLSLQSGCDETLKRMNRKYDTQKYYEAVEKLRKHMPDVGITTDIIVGFPAETEEEFETTVKFVQKVRFSKIHIFPYSPKTGTPAAKRKEQISPEVKDRRCKELNKVEEKLRKEFLESFLGKTVEVLFETEVKDNVYEGYTTNYVRVEAYSEQSLKNRILKVRINKAENDYIIGEITIA